MESRNSAPGRYGISGKVLTIAADILHKKIMEIFNACIDTGSFPKIWNTVFSSKYGEKYWEKPSSYLPICIINEAEKVLENILMDWIWSRINRVVPKFSWN